MAKCGFPRALLAKRLLVPPVPALPKIRVSALPKPRVTDDCPYPVPDPEFFAPTTSVLSDPHLRLHFRKRAFRMLRPQEISSCCGSPDIANAHFLNRHSSHGPPPKLFRAHEAHDRKSHAQFRQQSRIRLPPASEPTRISGRSERGRQRAFSQNRRALARVLGKPSMGFIPPADYGYKM